MSYRKNTVRFAVDFANKQIIATEANLNRAKRFGSDEYNELCKLMNAHPQFAVVKKEISQSAKKENIQALELCVYGRIYFYQSPCRGNDVGV